MRSFNFVFIRIFDSFFRRMPFKSKELLKIRAKMSNPSIDSRRRDREFTFKFSSSRDLYRRSSTMNKKIFNGFEDIRIFIEESTFSRSLKSTFNVRLMSKFGVIDKNSPSFIDRISFEFSGDGRMRNIKFSGDLSERSSLFNSTSDIKSLVLI
jgi:hypothetical protein